MALTRADVSCARQDCNQTVMSSGISYRFADSAVLLFAFDRVRCVSFKPFQVPITYVISTAEHVIRVDKLL